jgi:hypothetical protein
MFPIPVPGIRPADYSPIFAPFDIHPADHSPVSGVDFKIFEMVRERVSGNRKTLEQMSIRIWVGDDVPGNG